MSKETHAQRQYLVDFLREIQQHMGSSNSLSEAQIRMLVIDPILENLGWNMHNLANPEVIPEYSVRGGQVDYACLIDGQPQVIFEAKAIGRQIGGDELNQLFRYVWESNALLAVLTNGVEWRIYLTFVPGAHSETRKLVSNISVVDMDPDEAGRILWRYLSRERVASGQAGTDAAEKIKQDASRVRTRNAIPGAWRNLLEEENSIVVEHLIEKTAADCGGSPDRTDVLNFLRNLSSPPQATTSAESITRRHQDHAKRATSAETPSQVTPAGRGPVEFELFGEKESHQSAGQAYHRIINILAQKDTSFCERLARTINRRTIHLAAREEDIPVLKTGKRNAKPISSGWWLNMTLSNAQKIKHLETACRVANIEFRRDLKITLPTT